MNFYLLIIIFVLFSLIFWKWLLFILLSTFLLLRPSSPGPSEMIEEDADKTKSNVPCKNSSKESGLLDNIIMLVLKYYHGYMMYMDVQIGYIPSHHIRNSIYKYIYRCHLEKNVIIYNGCQIRGHKKLFIGNNSIIGDRCVLDARNGIVIGENVNLSTNVQIWTEQHDHNDPMFRSTANNSYKVEIGNRAWLGPDTIVLHGVHIGEGSVVAAGAVVTHDVLPFTIVAGIPAKEIKKRNINLEYEFNGSYVPFY